jgi:hypothetical protein
MAKKVTINTALKHVRLNGFKDKVYVFSYKLNRVDKFSLCSTISFEAFRSYTGNFFKL